MDTFQQRIAGRQAAMAMLEEYDTDINARESALWETAVNTLKTTTREERRIRYITLNRPELPETKRGKSDISESRKSRYKPVNASTGQ